MAEPCPVRALPSGVCTLMAEPCPAIFASARTTQGIASIPATVFVLISFVNIAVFPQSELAVPDRKKHGMLALLFAVALPFTFVIIAVNYPICEAVHYNQYTGERSPDPACIACLGWWYTPISLGVSPIMFVFNGLLLGGATGAAYVAWTCLCCIKCLQCKTKPTPRVMWAMVPLCVLITFVLGYLGCVIIILRVVLTIAARNRATVASSVAVIGGVPFSEAASTSLMANQAPGLPTDPELPTEADSTCTALASSTSAPSATEGLEV